MKLVALYKQPADKQSFDEKYFGTHVPLIEKVPQIRKTEIVRVKRTLVGEEFYLLATMHFDSEEALKAALKSPEMRAAGENLESFASGLYTLMTCEDDRQKSPHVV